MSCNPFSDDCGRLDLAELGGCRSGVELAAAVVDVGVATVKSFLCPDDDCGGGMLGFVSHGVPQFPPTLDGSYTSAWVAQNGIMGLASSSGAPRVKLQVGPKVRRLRVETGLWLGPVSIPDFSGGTLYLQNRDKLDYQGRLSTIIAETWWQELMNAFNDDRYSLEGLASRTQDRDIFYWSTAINYEGE